MTISDTPDWQNIGAQVASYIATGTITGAPGGVPLLNGDQLIKEQTANTTITTISSLVLGPYTVEQLAYIGAFGYEAGSTGGQLNVLVQWYDAIGNQVDTQSYWFFAGSPTFPNVVTIKGPTRGNYFYITFTAYTNNGTLTFFDIYQSSRIVDRHDWRSMQWNGSNLAGTIPTSDPPANFLAYCNAPAQGAGTSQTFLLPFFSGKISLYMQTSSGTSDMQVSLLNTADQASTSGDQIWLSNTSAQGIGYTPEIYLPRGQMSLKVNNGNAAAKNLFCSLIAADY